MVIRLFPVTSTLSKAAAVCVLGLLSTLNYAVRLLLLCWRERVRVADSKLLLPLVGQPQQLLDVGRRFSFQMLLTSAWNK
jgi:hypothetical protein